MSAPGLAARRVEVDWRGERLTTLADRFPDSARAVVVVLHPTACGVEDGHHLHQRLGQQALRRVLSALDVDPGDRRLDDALVAAGVGICTLVKRPAGNERQLQPGDVEHGRGQLLAALRERGVDLAICPFEPAARALAGRAVPPGVYDVDGLAVLRLAAPFAPTAERDAVIAVLRVELATRA